MINFTVSVIQFSNFEHNRLRDSSEILLMITDKINNLESTDVIVLPELATTPYIMNKNNIINAYSRFDTEMDIYKKIALSTKKYILATGIKFENLKIYNVALMIGPDGIVLGEYKKTHIPTGENLFSQGDDYIVIKTPIANFGILLCYDSHFPESFRILKKLGAEVVLIPINSVVDLHEIDIDIDNWRSICKYNALVNSVYIVTANKVENTGILNKFHTGHSIMVSPFGEIISEATMREQIITGLLSSSCFEKYQNSYSKHIRNDLYEKFKNEKK